MAVIHLQSLVSRIVSSVDGAGRVVKTAGYRQPQALLSLPTRSRVLSHRVRMPNRMRGHERLDFEAAMAARTGRSGGHAGGLPHRQGSTPRVWATLAKRSSGSFDHRNQLSRPCAWGRRFEV